MSEKLARQSEVPALATPVAAAAVAAHNAAPDAHGGVLPAPPPNLATRALLASFRAGGANEKVLFIGDSTMMGATTNTNGALQRAWPQRLAEAFPGLIRAGAWSGANQPPYNAASDSRRVLGAGWADTAAFSTVGGRVFTNTTTTGVFSFTPGYEFDRVEVYYLRGAITGEMTVAVDGGSAITTLSSNNAQTRYERAVISVPAGSERVDIARVSGTVYVGAVVCYDTAKPHLIAINAGLHGAVAGTFVASANPWDALNAITAIGPKLTVVCLTINDIGNATPLATYSANLQTILTRAKSVGDAIVVIGVPSGTTQFANAGASYIEACKAVASASGVPVLDLVRRWGGYSAANSAGLMADALHPTAVGYSEISAAFAEMARLPSQGHSS